MKHERLVSLDALRGLILIIMVLDHVSYFVAKIHLFEFWGIALPQYSSAAAFLTRFITHLCAPGFFFLMGAGIILMIRSRRKMGWPEIRIDRFLITRGLLLILMQFFLENTAWFLGGLSDRTGALANVAVPGGGDQVWIHFGVLYGLGAAMICSAVLRRLGTASIFLLSLGLFFLTQIAIPSPECFYVLFSPLHRMLLIPGRTGILQSYYPLIPWLGFAGLGLVFGKMLITDRKKTFRLCIPAGAASLLLFVIIRVFGSFGNFHPAPSDGLISFLNVTKYPPSPAFVFLTLGINLLLLYAFERWGNMLGKGLNPLLTFGRSSLFFYITHLFLFAFMGFLFPHGSGYGILYLMWGLGLCALYPLCLGYGRFKQSRPAESIWRFF